MQADELHALRGVLVAQFGVSSVRGPAGAGEEGAQRIVGGPYPPGGPGEPVRSQSVHACLQQSRAMAETLGERIDGELGDQAVRRRVGVRIVSGTDRCKPDHAMARLTGIDRDQHPQRCQRWTLDGGLPGLRHGGQVGGVQQPGRDRFGIELRPGSPLHSGDTGSLGRQRESDGVRLRGHLRQITRRRPVSGVG